MDFYIVVTEDTNQPLAYMLGSEVQGIVLFDSPDKAAFAKMVAEKEFPDVKYVIHRMIITTSTGPEQ